MTAGRPLFRLCPRCGRAVAAETQERFCINDGEVLLDRCAHCRAEIHSPYAQFCAHCGQPYSKASAPPRRRLPAARPQPKGEP